MPTQAAAPPRIAPLEPPFDEGIELSLDRLMGGRDLEPLALFRTIAHNPALLERFRQTGSSLLSFGTLEDSDRETVIQRVCARLGAEYEWGVHAAVFAPAVGLDEAWLAATVHGSADDPAFSPRQATLIRMVDELCDGAAVSDATWEELAQVYPEAQLVELLCLAGFYHLVAFLCRAARVPLESWAKRLPRVASTACTASGSTSSR